MDKVVGFRFSPTAFHLINYCLLAHIDTALIHHVISVVKICDYEPEFLPYLSKIESGDQTWYYLVPKEFSTGRNRKRQTERGFWKGTGEERKIRRRDGVEVGIKNTFVYHQGRVRNGVRTPWVMHEHEITSLPNHQWTYVVCKVMYNPFVGYNNSSETNQNMVIDSNNSSMNPAIITRPTVQQPVQVENFHGFSAIPEMFSQWDPNTYDNNNPSEQLQAPFVANVHRRFDPTDAELICYYLEKQNLGDTSVIHNVISVAKFWDLVPNSIPTLSKLKPDEPIWYFFSPNKFMSIKKRQRSTSTGFWKVTGKERKIKDVKRVVIGIKRSLVYHNGKVRHSVKTDWVMHEYEITSLHADKSTYVACKIMYNGEDSIPIVGNNSSMSPAINTGPQVDQIMNQHVDHFPSYDANTFSSENNNSHGMQLDDPNVVNAPEDGFMWSSDNNNFNIMSPARAGHEVQRQPIQEENFHGSYVNNHLEMAMNQHVDLSPSYFLDANTFFSDNNNPNMQPRTPYLTQDFEEYMNTLSAPSGVGQHQGEESCLESDEFNIDTYLDLVDYDHNS